MLVFYPVRLLRAVQARYSDLTPFRTSRHEEKLIQRALQKALANLPFARLRKACFALLPGHSCWISRLRRMLTPMAIRTSAPTTSHLVSSPSPMPSKMNPKMMLPVTGRR